MKKQKFTINKERFTKTIISFCAVMFLVTLLCNLAFGNTVSKEKDYIKVTVMSGDTLWKIASVNNTNGDVRKKIDDIIQFNHLKSSALQVNQELKIPIE